LLTKSTLIPQSHALEKESAYAIASCEDHFPVALGGGSRRWVLEE
jgi:hypothetical protein